MSCSSSEPEFEPELLLPLLSAAALAFLALLRSLCSANKYAILYLLYVGKSSVVLTCAVAMSQHKHPTLLTSQAETSMLQTTSKVPSC